METDAPFDPAKLNVGEVLLLRKTVRIPVPAEGETVTYGPDLFPALDINPKRFLSAKADAHIHPDDPGLVTITVLMGLYPQSFVDQIEARENALLAKQFEELGGIE